MAEHRPELEGPSEPETRVARGDRRDELWIEEDKDQLTRIRHGWPADHQPPHEQSEASERALQSDEEGLADTAELINDESAWEAREKGDQRP